MDAFTVGLIAAIIIIVLTCLIVFKFTAREQPFEKAYGDSALKLLASQPQDKLNRSKNKGKKPTKNEKKDVSIPLTERKPEISPKASEEVDSSEPTKNLPQKQTLEPHNSASGKRNVESKLVTSVITELENEDQQEDYKDICEASAAKYSNGNQQSSSQKSNSKNDDIEKVMIATTTSGVVKSEQKPLKQHIKVENITMAKLITRLRIFDELEKDYVDFLVSHSEKEEKLNAEHKILKKGLSDHEHSLKQTTSQLTNLQKEKATLLSNLKEQKEKYELFEKSVQPKLVEFRNENAQLKDDCKKLQSLITQAHQKLSQTHQLAEEVNGLRQELIRASNLIKEENQKAQFAKNMADNLMNELNMANNQLQEARLAPNMQQAYETQIQALQQELNVSKDQYNKNGVALDQLNAEIERMFASYKTIQAEHSASLQEFAKLKSINEELSKQVNSAQCEVKKWEERSNDLESKIGHNTFSINQTNNQYEQEKIRNATLMEENSKITESLQQYQLKLASLEKAAKQVSANDTLKMDELSNKNKELNAEISDLRAAIQLLQTSNKKSNNEDDQVKSLLAQLNDQRSRCSELREMNYKLHDAIEQLQSRPVQTPHLNGDDNQREASDVVERLKAEVQHHKAAFDSLQKKLEILERASQEVLDDQENVDETT